MFDIQKSEDFDIVFRVIYAEIAAGNIDEKRGSIIMQTLDAGRKLFTEIAGLRTLMKYIPEPEHTEPDKYTVIFNETLNQVLSDQMSAKTALMLIKNLEKQLRYSNELLCARVNAILKS